MADRVYRRTPDRRQCRDSRATGGRSSINVPRGWVSGSCPSSPSAVRTYGRGLRSLPTPSAAQLDAFARVFAHADVGYVGNPAPARPARAHRRGVVPALARQLSCTCGVGPRRPQVMREVQQRQIDLDEFERRHPGAYAAWLASGPENLDYLTPYDLGGRVGDTTINWDELTLGRD